MVQLSKFHQLYQTKDSFTTMPSMKLMVTQNLRLNEFWDFPPIKTQKGKPAAECPNHNQSPGVGWDADIHTQNALQQHVDILTNEWWFGEWITYHQGPVNMGRNSRIPLFQHPRVYIIKNISYLNKF